MMAHIMRGAMQKDGFITMVDRQKYCDATKATLEFPQSIKSDVGLEAAEEIRGIISQKKIDPKKNLLGEVNNILKQYIFELADLIPKPLQ